MKRLLTGLLLSTALMCVPVSVMANQAYDFSDIYEPFFTLPFNVTSTEVTGTYEDTHHYFHIAESMDKVVKKLGTMYDKKQKLGEYFIMGITEQYNHTYQIVIGLRNEHHYVMLSEEGSGCLFDMKAMPNSYITGVYPISVYGFSMPDGTMVSVDKFTEE